MAALGLHLRIKKVKAKIAAVVTTALQMWHTMSASTWTGSDRLSDSSGNGNTAALYTGRGLSFDGVNDVVTIGDTGQTVKTVVFYVYPDTTTEVFMQLQSSGAVRIEIASGTLSVTGFTSPTLYVNGAAGSTVAATTWQMIAVTSATGVSASNVLLGQSNTDYGSIDMSNVKFFSTELTAGQVAELYANPEQALPTGVSAGELVGWWQLGALAAWTVNSSTNNKAAINSGASIVNQINFGPQLSLLGSSRRKYFNDSGQYLNFTTPITLTSAGDYIEFKSFPNVKFERAGLLGHPSSAYLTLSSYSNSVLRNVSSNFIFSPNPWSGLVTGTLATIKFTKTSSGYTLNVNGTEGSVTTVSNATFSFLFGYFNPMGLENFDGIHVSAELYKSGAFVGRWKAVNDWQDEIGTNHCTTTGSPTDVIWHGITTDSGGLTIANPNTGEIILHGAGYALATDAATLDITTNITLEAWVKPFTVAANQTAIGKNNAYALNITSGAKLQFQRWSSASSGTVASSASLAVDTWYHIAATYDGTTTKLYIDGAEDTSSGSITGAIDATATDVLMGALTSSTQLFSGYLDSVKIYDEVKTAAEILENYNAEKNNHQN